MRLRCQIVDFVRPNQTDDPDQTGGVGQIAVMEMNLIFDIVIRAVLEMEARRVIPRTS